MAKTSKSERQYRKADAGEVRAAGKSHRDLSESNGSAHRAHAKAFDRHDAKLSHFDRDYGRATRRGHA